MRSGQIRLEQRFPVVRFHAHCQAIARDGCVVHQNIEPAEFFEDLFEAGLHLFAVGYVHLHCQRRAAGGLDFPDQRGKSFFVAGCHGHFRSGFRESKRSIAPDALRRAGNESYFIF